MPKGAPLNVTLTRLRAGVACAALAVAVLAGCGPTEPEVSLSPSFTDAPPSPAPTATVDANGRALPGYVTVAQDLPAALPAPQGLLASTGPGWSLQTYRPQVTDDAAGFGATAQVVYLVSPQGKRYQLLELDPAAPIVIDSWSAGATVAYVRQCDPLACDPATPTLLLSLLSGELSPASGVPDALSIGATLPGNTRWWQDATSASALDNGAITPFAEPWTAVSASPSGRYLAVARADDASGFLTSGLGIVDASSGIITDLKTLWPEPLSCKVFRWRTNDALDVNCYDGARETWRVFTVGPGAAEMKENKSAMATPPDDGPWVEPQYRVSDGVWAGPYTADAQARLTTPPPLIGVARNAGFEPLAVPDAAVGFARIDAVVGGRIFVEASQAANPSLHTAWTYDVAEDLWTQIGPLPPAGPTRGLLAAQGAPASGMTSWAVAP